MSIGARVFAIVLVLSATCAAATTDIAVISHGREVVLEEYLVPGKLVLFDFYADWCGPCRMLEPHLEELAGRHSDRLAIRKIDVINWDSAVARQYRLSSIPYLILYGPDGTRIAAGDASSVLRRLQSALGGSMPQTRGRRHSFWPVAMAVAAVLAVVILVARRRGPADRRDRPVHSEPIDTVADPRDPAIWWTMVDGSLAGPFTRRQLAEMERRGVLARDADVRRKGDAEWTRLGAVID